FCTAGLFFYPGGWPMRLWGGCMRTVVAYHRRWLVNSASPLRRYRTHARTDQSRHRGWLACRSFRGCLPRHPRAQPAVAPAGHKWWEFDPTWQAIKTLRFFGQAYDVDDRIPAEA